VVKEISWLARVFDQVTHVACVRDGPAPPSALPYAADVVGKLRLVLVPPAGGLDLRGKSRVILNAPRYTRTILSNVPKADVVHIRCPGSLGMYGIVLVSRLSKKMRWAKYGGNWMESGRMPPSFAFQRWWLRKGLVQGPTTVNGQWPDQRGHVFAFDNPSLTLDDIRYARSLACAKVLEMPVRFIFVGRVVSAKGLGVILEIMRHLLSYYGGAASSQISLDILGDGHERAQFERLSEQMGLAETVHFYGWVSHDRVPEFLRRSHFILLPSQTEGWPKVLSEAMAHGVVPITSQVSAIPQTLAEIGTGIALPPDDVLGFVHAIRAMIQNRPRWQQMVQAGLDAAPRFSYERYLIRLDDMLRTFYGSSPFSDQALGAIREQLDGLASHT
jgi:glycosyltransferase involved in cell wall biosynthesis